MSVPQWARLFCFQNAGSGLIPLLEGADGDLLLEQRSRSRGGEATLTLFALRGHQAIGCCCAHGKQLLAAFLSRSGSARAAEVASMEMGRKGMRRLAQMLPTRRSRPETARVARLIRIGGDGGAQVGTAPLVHG